MIKNRKITSSLLATLLIAGACTDLEVKEKDSLVIVTEEGSFAGVDPTAALVTSYSDLRDFANQENIFSLSEVTSDELLVPTRGTDWGDNGIFRTLLY